MNTRTIYIGAIVIVCMMIASGFIGYELSATNPSAPTTLQKGSLVTGYNYIIFYDSGTYFARNGTTGAIDYSNTNLSALINSVNTKIGAEGGLIYSEISHSTIDTRIVHMNQGFAITVTGNTAFTMYNRIGAGQIKSFWITLEDNGHFRDCKLRFTIDGNTMVNITIGDIFGLYDGLWSNSTATKLSYQATHIGANIDAGNYYGGGYFTIPINFKTALKIEFFAQTAGAILFYNIYSLNLTINDRTTRFSAVNFNQGLHLSYTQTLTMVNITGKSGRFLFATLTEHDANTAQFYYLEENPILKSDGHKYESTGTEDFFLHSEYWNNVPAFPTNSVGPNVGTIIKNSTTFTTAAFRDFYGEQNGVAFQTSFSFYIVYNEDRGTNNINYGYFCMWEEY